jgi:BASS family bile acid:Na+ symporter
MEKASLFILKGSVLAATIALLGIFFQQPQWYQPFALVTTICFAIGLGAVPSLKGYQYTVWIIVAVVAGMLYPTFFKQWGPINLRDKTLLLVIIQLVMFGMGTHIKLKDFTGMASTGKGVLVGLICHFSIMPLTGLLITKIFKFEPEIAAGIILIGSCSSGLASNVMVYLAKGNLVLSVIVTAMATLLAPLITPFLLKTLAGSLIEIKFIDMMLEIIKMVLIPIGAGLFHDYLKNATVLQQKKAGILTIVSVIWILIGFGLQTVIKIPASLQSIELSMFFCAAIIVGFLYNKLFNRFPGLDKFLPLISMFGIFYFITVTTAAGRDNLLKVGGWLFFAAVLHNAAGYFFGYWCSRLFGMDKNSSRTIAFEVGLQNGGMASGIAGSMGKLGTVGLAAAVFSPWMNISGSLLANFWRRKPIIADELIEIKMD